MLILEYNWSTVVEYDTCTCDQTTGTCAWTLCSLIMHSLRTGGQTDMLT